MSAKIQSIELLKSYNNFFDSEFLQKEPLIKAFKIKAVSGIIIPSANL